MFFRENGYHYLKPEIDTELIEKAIADCEPEYVNQPASGRIQDDFKFSNSVNEIACLPEITNFLDLAFGKKVFPFHWAANLLIEGDALKDHQGSGGLSVDHPLKVKTSV